MIFQKEISKFQKKKKNNKMKIGTLILNNKKIEILFLENLIMSEVEVISSSKEIEMNIYKFNNIKWNFFIFYVKENLKLYSHDNSIIINNIYLINLKINILGEKYDVHIINGELENTGSDMEGYNRYRLNIINGELI